jgi:hypothetical protein
MFPDNVGFPVGENPGKEYFMLEIHYDNPDKIANLTFAAGINIFYAEDRSDDDPNVSAQTQFYF